jgi:hypothetical protein
MTRRAPSCPRTSEQRLKPSQGDAHDALIALVRLLARAEARRWLEEGASKQEQDDDQYG